MQYVGFISPSGVRCVERRNGWGTEIVLAIHREERTLDALDTFARWVEGSHYYAAHDRLRSLTVGLRWLDRRTVWYGCRGGVVRDRGGWPHVYCSTEQEYVAAIRALAGLDLGLHHLHSRATPSASHRAATHTVWFVVDRHGGTTAQLTPITQSSQLAIERGGGRVYREHVQIPAKCLHCSRSALEGRVTCHFCSPEHHCSACPTQPKVAELWFGVDGTLSPNGDGGYW